MSPCYNKYFAQWEKGERFSSKNGHWETVRNLSAETLACMDHYTFLGNSPPTPPLSQHFALSEK